MYPLKEECKKSEIFHTQLFIGCFGGRYQLICISNSVNKTCYKDIKKHVKIANNILSAGTLIRNSASF